MDRRLINLLIVNDDDLECNTGKVTLSDLNLNHLSFSREDLDPFELIVYSGKRGVKILKSRYFKSGKIK